MEMIQELVNKGEIKKKTSTINVMMVSHSKRRKWDEPFEGEKIEEIKVQGTKVSSTSAEEMQEEIEAQFGIQTMLI